MRDRMKGDPEPAEIGELGGIERAKDAADQDRAKRATIAATLVLAIALGALALLDWTGRI